MLPPDLDGLRSRLIIGGAAVVSIVFFALISIPQLLEPGQDVFICALMGGVILLAVALARMGGP